MIIILPQIAPLISHNEVIKIYWLFGDCFHKSNINGRDKICDIVNFRNDELANSILHGNLY